MGADANRPGWLAVNEALREQNHTIEKQNEMLKRLSQERDELVAKLNARTEEYNKLVKLQNAGR